MQAILAKWAAGDHEAAVKDLVQYLQDHSEDIEAYVTLATFLTTLKDFEQAEALLQKALTNEVRPKSETLLGLLLCLNLIKNKK